MKMKVKNIPIGYKKTIDSIRKSRVFVVKAFCLQCMGFEKDCADMIRNCSAKWEVKDGVAIGCPLYNWRPYKKRGERKL